MIVSELHKLISQGECSTVSLNERVEDCTLISAEMAAFSNSKGGGKFLVGVNPQSGLISGLSFQELQKSTDLLFTAATQYVNPSINITTETVVTDCGNVLVATIAEGRNKPYRDSENHIWVKNASRKTELRTTTELASLLQSCGAISADTCSVEGCCLQDLDKRMLVGFLIARFPDSFTEMNLESRKILSIDDAVMMIAPNMTVEQLLINLGFMDKEGRVLLGALLLFGEQPQRFNPSLVVHCTSFAGNSLVSTEVRTSKLNIDGCLSVQYAKIMAFLAQNLCAVGNKSENGPLHALEIPFPALHELVVNALVHRDYFQQAPIRLFVFDDRIEIHSPGALPFSIGEEGNVCGISKPRNFILFNNANISGLHYTGVGCGFMRALNAYDSIEIKDDRVLDEVVVTIKIVAIAYDIALLDNEVVSYSSDRVSDIDTDIVYDRVEALTERQKRVLLVCLKPQSSRELLKMIDVTYHPDAVKLYIRDLIELGCLQLTIPEKPTSPNQRYFTTEFGKTLLPKRRK